MPRYRKSDLTGNDITDADDIVELLIHRHPDKKRGGATWLTVALPELAGLKPLRVASLELWLADGGEAVMEVDADILDGLASRWSLPELVNVRQPTGALERRMERWAHRHQARNGLILAELRQHLNP